MCDWMRGDGIVASIDPGARLYHLPTVWCQDGYLHSLSLSSHLKNDDNKSTYLTEHKVGIHKLILKKCLDECLKLNK